MSKELLKAKFENGDRPTGEDFAELINSIHMDADIDILVEKNVGDLLDEVEVSRGSHESIGNRLDAIDEDLSAVDREIDSPLSVELTNYGSSFQWNTDSAGKKYDAVNSVNNDMVFKGQTLVNINPSSNYWFSTGTVNTGRYTEVRNPYSVKVDISENLESWRYVVAGTIDIARLKPNTQYTICFRKCTGLSNVRLGSGDSTVLLTDTVNFNGKKQVLLTTKSTLESTQPIYVFCNISATAGQSIDVEEAILLEGNHIGKSLEYFKGVQSAGQSNDNNVKILSTGKNLYPYGDISSTWTNAMPESLIGWIKVKPNTTYTASRNANKGILHFIEYNNNEKTFSNHNDCYTKRDGIERKLQPNVSELTFTTGDNINYVYCTLSNYTESTTTPIHHTEIMLEEGSTKTTYEPYISNDTEIVLDEPLRSLPSGVADTIELKDGKVIVTRNCGEVVLTGNESWSVYPRNESVTMENTIAFISSGSGIGATSIHTEDIFSDKFASRNIYQEDVEGIFTKYSVRIGILKTRLETQDITGFKKWLTNNPVTVVFELDKPIIEEYYLKNVDSYPNGHVIMETGAIPLESISHKVSLNMREQISDAVTNVKVNKRLLVDILARLEAGGL